MNARRRQRDAHAIMVEEWLDNVLADSALTRMDFSVAWAVSLHFNRASHCAWAAVDEYARRCHTDRRTVQRSLRRLERTGHLASTKGGGRKRTNRYQPILTNSGAGAAVSDPENSGADAAVSAPERAASQPQKGGEPAPKAPQNSGTSAAQPLNNNRPLRTSDSSARAIARADDRAPDDLDLGFERWWPLYPKHEAQAAARREYDNIVRSSRATPAELDRGAMIYAAACDAREARYIASPARWLKDERWKDEPPTQAASSRDNPIEVAAELARVYRGQRP